MARKKKINQTNDSFRNVEVPCTPTAPPYTDTLPFSRQERKEFEARPCGINYWMAGSPTSDEDGKPSAPPPDLFDIVPGYEDLSYEPIDIPPPEVPTVSRQEGEEGHGSSILSESLVTESVARNAFLKYADHHCCFKKKVGHNMVITHMEPSSAFHYQLETFTEKRQTNWKCEPYRGGAVDGPENGSAPTAWEIVATPPNKFEANSVVKEVPHTASVKTCYRCGGTGRRKCEACSGKGGKVCYACDGNGHSNSTFQQGDSVHCYVCHGGGNQKCYSCKGEGLKPCSQCGGTGQIKCYIGVSIEWICHCDDYISDACSIPDEFIKTVNGTVALVEELPLVWPLDSFPDLRVGMASAQLIQKHSADFPAEKILLQSQTVKIIPVTTVHYQWKNKDRSFIIYGQENHVYSPKYPNACCCTII